MSSIPAIHHTRISKIRKWKMYWYFIFLASSIACFYHVQRFLLTFFSYPTSVDLEVESNISPKFPAVTFCNLNTIHSKYENCLSKIWKNCIRHKMINCVDCSYFSNHPRKINTFKNSVRTRFENGTRREEAYRYLEKRYRSAANAILTQYLDLDAFSRKCYGHQLQELVQSCSFQSQQCKPEDFTYYQSLQYGNCYTFKDQQQGRGSTDAIGPGSGLELDLNIEEVDYLEITKVFGLRLVIHNPEEDPNLDNGINISPGYETHVAMNKVSHERLPKPYGDGCRVYEYFNENNNTAEKSMDKCIRHCFYKYSMCSCSCVDPFFASDGMQRCDVENIKKMNCLKKVLQSLNEGSLECDCPPPCFSTTRNLLISHSKLNMRYSKIPSNAYIDQTCSYVYDKEENDVIFYDNNKNAFMAKASTAESFNSFDKHKIQSNMKLKIYYKTSDHKIFVQKATYANTELFAFLGGNLNLWLGFSFASLIEIIESMLVSIKYIEINKMLALFKTF